MDFESRTGQSYYTKPISISMPKDIYDKLEKVRGELRMTRTRYILDAINKELDKDMQKK